MKLISNLLLALILSIFNSCGEENLATNNRSSILVKNLKNDLEDISSLTQEIKNQEDLLYINDKVEALETIYGDSLSAIFKGEINQLKRNLEKVNKLNYIEVFSKEGIFTKEKSYQKAFYGLSKDSIKINFKADKRIKSLKIVEEKSGRVVKKQTSNKLNFKFDVYYDNPYSIIIDFKEETYFDLKIYRKPASIENKFSDCKLIRDSILVNQKTKRSKSGKQMVQTKVFNEPKKFIVSKSFSLSGEPKVYAPVELPKNTIEFIYTLRISGEDYQLSEDGTLFSQIDRSYKKIKLLGLPLWESKSEGNSITREILNSLFKPKKDEDYTLNVFFFEKQSEIKKFINYSGEDYSSAFAYDINNSAVSTQSRVGLIKKPKSGFSYIGLQTNSTFSDTYAWLDVVALSENTFYYEIKYKLQKK